jgi:putative sterol carrier protein
VASTYPFLSPEWITAARAIRDQHIAKAANALPEGLDVKMNQIITDVPFGEGVIDAHIDSSSGSLSLDLGHLDAVDLTITVDYDTAKSIFIDQDMGMAMQAFMTGKIRVDGDLSKLLALQAVGTQNVPDGAIDTAQSIADQLKSITAD